MSTASIFEDFANEVICEIFDFLDHYHIYNAFHNLNSRFNDLLHWANTLQHIDMSYLSKPNFQRYSTEMIQPNSHRIHSLHLGNRWMFEEIFSTPENVQRFSALRTIILDNMVTFNALDRLTSCPNLSSLIIHGSDRSTINNTTCQPILSLPHLRYCKMSMNGPIIFRSPLNFSNEQNTLDHLVLKGECDIHLLSYLLSSPLQFRRLSIDQIVDLHLVVQLVILPISDRLTHLSLKPHRMPFDLFEPFLIRFPPSIQVLQLSFNEDKQYLSSDRWEHLITTHFPNLSVFDIKHTCCTRNDNERQWYENQIQEFNSPFWLDRNWYFGYQHGRMNANISCHVFYSVRPYRRRSHFVCGQHHQDHLLSSDYNRVNRVEIYNSSVINDCSIFFANAEQLTLSLNGHQRIPVLDQIVSLKKLRKINLRCQPFHLDILIDLLNAASNCSQLTLSGQLTNEIPLSSMTNHTNKTTSLVVKTVCTLEHVKFFTKLCSQLRHLSVFVRAEELKSILQYLLSECGTYTPHLALLDLQSTTDIYLEKLGDLLDNIRLSRDVSIENTGYTACHLWC